MTAASEGRDTAECPFCKRIENWDVEQSYSMTVVRFEPLSPVTEGHMLFVPVRHSEQPHAEGIRAAMSYAESYAGEQGCDFNLITSSGVSATQTVPHVHVHYVPRRAGDGLALPWTVASLASRPAVPAAIGELIAELRANNAQERHRDQTLALMDAAADALESLLAQTAGGQK